MNQNLGPQFPQRVPVENLPVKGRDDHPYGISRDDEPREYFGGPEESHWRQSFGSQYELQHVPLASLHPDHEHTAECYHLTDENEARHDVDPEPGYDYDYVKGMAEDVDKLPALVLTRNRNYFGGGHRTAAFHEAGRTHIPAWVPVD